MTVASLWGEMKALLDPSPAHQQWAPLLLSGFFYFQTADMNQRLNPGLR